MAVVPETLIADRYKLLECLGAGGMGEVWKAQDTNFTRLVVVAVKLLKEDETFKDDQRNRDNLARYLQREAAAGHLSFELIVNAMDESFNAGVKRDLLRKAAESRFKDKEITSDEAIAFFDELVNDSTFNENARHRRRLRDLFATEANSVAILQHPNIVRVTDFGEHSGVPFLVMDFINGRTLQQVIQRREPMPVTKRLKLMEDLCEGLGYAHLKELIHRDIKPANLIIDSESKRLKVLDFGVVRTMQFSAQRSVSMGAPIGTYCYMSPEQTRASRTLDNRSDIFSTGLVFYELLAFQRAFPSAGDISELIGRIQRDQPPPLRDLAPDLDPQVEAIVYKAIEKVPAKRYADLAEMQRDIEVVRRRLEEEERKRAEAGEGGTVLVRPKPILQQVTDLVDRANSAFETGDDHAVIEFSDQILLLVANQPDAIELKERARERIRLKIVEASINDGRALLARGEITQAGEVLNRAEIDTKFPIVRRFKDDLSSARRTRRLALLIREARRYLEQGQLNDAVDRAGRVLEVDPNNADARRIEEQARSALLTKERLPAALADAEKAAEEIGLEEAIRILKPYENDPQAAPKIALYRKELEEIERRDQAIRSALVRSRELIAAEKFVEARDLLAEAKSLDPENEEMAGLRRWLRPVTKAIGQADEAIRLFEQGSLQAAEGQLQPALDVLNSFKDNYPSIRKRLETAEAAWIAALDRDKERKRQELAREQERQRREAEAEQERQRLAALEEQRRVEAAVAEAAKKARAAVGKEKFDEAERLLTALSELPASEAAVAEVRRELNAARVLEAGRRTRAAIGKEKFEDAERLLAQLADLPDGDAAAAECRHELDAARVAEAARRVRAAIAKEKFDDAEHVLAFMLDLPESQAAVAQLRNELSTGRAAAFDSAATRHRDAARAIASRGDLEGALAKLREFAPEHPAIEVEIKAVGLAIQRRDDDRARAEKKRQDDEKARLEAERKRAEEERLRAEAERKRQEQLRLEAQEAERKRQEDLKAKKKLEERVDRALAQADSLFAAGKRAEALEVLTQFEPDHPRIDERLAFLRKEIHRLDEAARVAAERQRFESQHRDVMGRATSAAGKGDYATALDILTAAAKGDLSSDAEIVRLRSQVLLDLRAAFSKDRANPTLQALVTQYDPWFARRRLIIQAGSAAAALLLVTLVALRLPSSSSKAPVTTATAPPATTIPATTTIPAPPPEMGVLTVDFRPWARVRITPTDSSVKVSQESQVTPFVITLPAGEYTLHAENDGLTPPVDMPVKLDKGEVKPVSVQMPGFRVDAVVDQLLKGR